MVKSILLTIVIALLASITLWLIFFRSPDCKADGAMLMQVGETRYYVPAWMDPYPWDGDKPNGIEKSSISQVLKGYSDLCQKASVPVIKTRFFGFMTRPRGERSSYPYSTPAIVHLYRLSPQVRPKGASVDWRDIRSVTYEKHVVSADGNYASIVYYMQLRSGPPRQLRAKCLYGEYDKKVMGQNYYIQRCVTRIPLGQQNVLEINVNPGNDPAVIGRELIHSLQAVEKMKAPR